MNVVINIDLKKYLKSEDIVAYIHSQTPEVPDGNDVDEYDKYITKHNKYLALQRRMSIEFDNLFKRFKSQMPQFHLIDYSLVINKDEHYNCTLLMQCRGVKY